MLWVGVIPRICTTMLIPRTQHAVIISSCTDIIGMPTKVLVPNVTRALRLYRRPVYRRQGAGTARRREARHRRHRAATCHRDVLLEVVGYAADIFRLCASFLPSRPGH